MLKLQTSSVMYRNLREALNQHCVCQLDSNRLPGTDNSLCGKSMTAFFAQSPQWSEMENLSLMRELRLGHYQRVKRLQSTSAMVDYRHMYFYLFISLYCINMKVM